MSSTAWSSSVRAEVVVAVVAVVADGVLADVVVEVDVRGSVVVVAEADPLVAVGGLLVTGAEPLWSAGPVFAEAALVACSAAGRPATGAGVSGWRVDSPGGTVPTPSTGG